MVRKVLLSVAALITLAIAGVSTAEAGHGYHGGYHGHGHCHGGPRPYYGYGGYGPAYPSYNRAYYGGPGYYGGSGVSYYQSRGGYGRSHSGVGISIGF